MSLSAKNRIIIIVDADDDDVRRCVVERAKDGERRHTHRLHHDEEVVQTDSLKRFKNHEFEVDDDDDDDEVVENILQNSINFGAAAYCPMSFLL